LDNALSDKEEIQTQLTQALSEKETLQIELNAIIQERDNLSAENAELQAQIEILNQQIAELQAQIEELQNSSVQATSASYFTFSDGEITGLSTEGQSLYDAGELTEIVFPSSYSIGEVTTSEETFATIDDLMIYCDSNSNIYPITINDSDIVINSVEDIFANTEVLEGLMPVTATITNNSYVNGNDYSVVSIGRSAFNSFSKLTSVTILNSVTSIGDYAFGNCTNLQLIDIGKGVTSIGQTAFGGCSNLTKIVIPGNVKSIGQSAFYSCKKLSNVTLSDGIETIGVNAFGSCTELTSIALPKSITSIWQTAFSDCTNLTSIDLYSTTPPTLKNTNAIPSSVTTIHIPVGTKTAYESADVWKDLLVTFVELQVDY
ncbi:MAG: leucine-rich repeat protein, partial [Alphaproteobacteria bacterium]|nr:leucine-rich repeat protein [Alphaproteobacteria bacterium]